MTKQTLHIIRNTLLPGILNSYSIIFFLNNRFFALVLMLTSFFNFYAGLSGLMAVVIALIVGKWMHLDDTTLRKGIYSFNALLTGLGMGTFFDPGIVFYSLLLVVTVFCLLFSVGLSGWLNKYNLPQLSIPFVISFWFLLLPAAQFENLGLTQRNIYWMNEMYAIGGSPLLQLFQTIDALPLHQMVDLYLRSLSSVVFQSNLITGFLIAIALLAGSRILFSLSVVGFLSAYLFALFTGSEAASMTYYNIGANYMMVAFAIGGFFIIPSKHSYLWTIFLVPLTSLILLFFNKMLAPVQLPVFSLPFSVTVILFLFFLQQRVRPNGLVFTPYQHYSPEENLYTFRTNSERFSRFMYKSLQLPFWGEWTVWQGYDGEYTHLGEWGKALDFVVKDTQGSTYRAKGYACEDYYCYKKPVVAVADGVVEVVTDNIDDNEPGKINTQNNWGNSIVINHYNGIYSQVSHLKKGSARVKPGDTVKAGDIIGLCGNSGRSPEPHLHFQLQLHAYTGAKTYTYPIAYYYTRNDTTEQLQQFSVPAENENIRNIQVNKLLADAFNILPDKSFVFEYTSDGKNQRENWNAYTDAYNNKYLHCPETNDVAYYVCDGKMFYFTTYYGGKKSLLYYFFLSAYKVFLSTEGAVLITDSLPLPYVSNKKWLIWLNDFISPFTQVVEAKYRSETTQTSTSQHDTAGIKSDIQIHYAGNKQFFVQSSIVVTTVGIHEINIKTNSKEITAKCVSQQ